MTQKELVSAKNADFVIGRVDSQNPQKVTGISVLQGAQPFNNFQKELDSALK